jgi:hypothetical protein
MIIEAMKQALEVLEFAKAHGEFEQGSGVLHEINNSSTTLRQAIAEAEKQEPVGFYDAENNDLRQEIPMGEDGDWWQPVYTHPQPKREPLTDEHILNLARGHYNPHQRPEISFARAIEAAHGIKEKNT